MSKFSSDGFDLDAMGGDGVKNGDVVYEIGGGATVSPAPQKSEEEATADEKTAETPMDQAEEYKQKGNEEFKQRNFLEAYDFYTEAIEACPCPIKGEEILRQRDEFDAFEREKLMERRRLEEVDRRRHSKKSANRSNDDDASEERKEVEPPKEGQKQPSGPEPFVLPPQPYGDKLAVFYSNRAATLMHLERYDDCVADCNVAVLLNPAYTKAWTRRSAAYEKTERTEEALRDAKRALELEPSNATIRKTVARLQKQEDERLEKLKVSSSGTRWTFFDDLLNFVSASKISQCVCFQPTL